MVFINIVNFNDLLLESDINYMLKLSTSKRKDKLMSKEVKNLEHAEAAPIEELEDLKAFWTKYGHYICITLLAIVIVIYGCKWFNSKQTVKIIEAQAELNAATTAEELAIVVDNNRSSYVTPIASLKLGAAYFADGRYDEAILTYQDFLAKFGSHALAVNAKYSLAMALEANGAFDEAIAKFKEISEEGPFAQEAKLGMARCSILKGDKDNGKAILDMFIADNAGKPVVIRAEALLFAINRLQNPAPKSAEDLTNFFAAPQVEAASEPVAPAAEAPAAEVPAAK